MDLEYVNPDVFSTRSYNMNILNCYYNPVYSDVSSCNGYISMNIKKFIHMILLTVTLYHETHS